MRIRAGTSGFSYAAWKGRFYPPKLPASQMLAAYATRLPTVEINATFYRMPQAKTLASWREAVPPTFVFALKGSRRVTHIHRLDDVAEEVAFFYRTVAELEGTLGPVLWQLPPSAKKDLGRLRAFVELLPRGGRAAMEFRHESWLAEEALTVLADAGVALCIADDEEHSTPVVATARFGYLRLRRPDYDAAALARWAERVRSLAWEEAFVFFKHEEEARGPDYALRFGELVDATDAPHPQP
jgi:uncharacterized protein YecE (DUF72 family)